ncbi:FxsA family protein [Helicobacter sp. MIT 11-5569]|uniref:FxsA family protein n=1 Tax=Helicobacter sp. MIT 11-5569 TaxID=1548151 RepID=UPI00051FA7A5|nr:FxsA family protein [Helicobacter sp. MIT 11-5569]TLD82420.1 FxsA family protein [Helicobacter sp. MIT 11-5569]
MPLILGFLYLFLEVLVSYEVIDFIGVLGFVLEIIITALLGFFILVNFRLFVNDALIRLRDRQLSYEAFVGSNIFRILGAILLILPGALTDIIGILMQFSAVGFMFVKPFVQSNSTQNPKNTQDSTDIIDVEIIEKDEKSCKS